MSLKIIIKTILILIFLSICTKVIASKIEHPEVQYRHGNPDLINTWNAYKGIDSGDEIKKTIQKGIVLDLNNQLAKFKIPSKVNEKITIPLSISKENYHYYYICKQFDKKKLEKKNPIFWTIRNNNQTVLLNKMSISKFDIDYEEKDDIEIFFDNNQISSENVMNLTIKRVANSLKDNYKISLKNVFFEGEGQFDGPWGYWDGTYGDKIFEPGNWKDYKCEEGESKEEFDFNTPRYFYATAPKGELDDIELTIMGDLILTGEAESQKMLLGTRLEDLNFNDFVKNIKIGDQKLESSQYTTELITTFSTEYIGEQISKVRVSPKSNVSVILELDVPITIDWGNTVAFGCYDYYGEGRTSAAFVLDSNDPPVIIATLGIGDDNKQIHTEFSGEKYFSFNWLDMRNQSSAVKISDDMIFSKGIEATGEELKKDTIQKWGINQRQLVNYGDIIQASQIEEHKNWLYENGERKAYNKGNEVVYYEVTSNGYNALYFNLLDKKVGDVPIYASKEYLDTHIEDFLDKGDNDSVQIKHFSEYPNTKKEGASKAKIQVEETLVSNKVIQYEYEILINVGKGSIELAVPNNIVFNSFEPSKTEQIIQRSDSEDLKLGVKDSRGIGKQGNWYVTVKTKSKKGIAPYLIYRESGKDDQYVIYGAKIYSQNKEISVTKPLEVDISNLWDKNEGILLKIPVKNNLVSNKKYREVLIWNIVQGP